LELEDGAVCVNKVRYFTVGFNEAVPCYHWHFFTKNLPVKDRDRLCTTKVGLMHDPQTSRDKLSSKNLNGIRNSEKLKNPAAQSYGEFSSLHTYAAEILIFVVLRV
jgi:hypothetical protein